MFESSHQLSSSPVHHSRWKLRTVPLITKRLAGKLWIPIFTIYDLIRPVFKTKSTVLVADALSKWPLIDCLEFWIFSDLVDSWRYNATRNFFTFYGAFRKCFWKFVAHFWREHNNFELEYDFFCFIFMLWAKIKEELWINWTVCVFKLDAIHFEYFLVDCNNDEANENSAFEYITINNQLE